jgi:hypothetical protein
MKIKWTKEMQETVNRLMVDVEKMKRMLRQKKPQTSSRPAR